MCESRNPVKVLIMRMLNRDTNEPLYDVGIYLTKEEVYTFLSQWEYLIKHPESHHFHFSVFTDSRGKEITGTVYSEDNMDTFDARSKKLILEDK